MSNGKPRQETLTALNAIFSPSMSKDARSNHLILIAVTVITALRQVESDEFVLGFLKGAKDDIEQGNAYAVARLKTERLN